MSNHKLTFTLQQHTPLIHFQHEQDGATLRATEVKPKLDKYLIENHPGGWDKIPPEWKVDNRKNAFQALKYKLRFEADSQDKVEVPLEKKFPAFFANLGEENPEKLKHFSMYKNIRAQILAFNNGLAELIEQCLGDFFNQTNFGTRQSKGFGSFTLSAPERLVKTVESDYYFKVSTPRPSGRDRDRPVSEKDKQKNLFENIDWFYRSLRSGLNLYDSNNTQILYFKSMLFLYAYKERDEQWDKKTIKEHFSFISSDIANQKSRHIADMESPLFAPAKSKKPLLRDLLGLATEQAWKGYEQYHGDKKTLQITGEEKIKKGGKETNEPLIARFKSPVFFKPIMDGDDFKVYFGVHHHVKKAFLNGDSSIAKEAGFLNRPFEISFKDHKGDPPKTLWTPTHFDFDAFFEFAFTRDLSMHVDEDFSESREYKALEKIYQQLRKQVESKPSII